MRFRNDEKNDFLAPSRKYDRRRVSSLLKPDSKAFAEDADDVVCLSHGEEMHGWDPMLQQIFALGDAPLLADLVDVFFVCGDLLGQFHWNIYGKRFRELLNLFQSRERLQARDYRNRYPRRPAALYE